MTKAKSFDNVGGTTIRRELRKKIPLPGGSGRNFTTEHAGYEYGDIEVLVDAEALVRAIGHKALASKKGVSKIQGGAVTLRVVRRWRSGGGNG